MPIAKINKDNMLNDDDSCKSSFDVYYELLSALDLPEHIEQFEVQLAPTEPNKVELIIKNESVSLHGKVDNNTEVVVRSYNLPVDCIASKDPDCYLDEKGFWYRKTVLSPIVETDTMFVSHFACTNCGKTWTMEHGFVDYELYENCPHCGTIIERFYYSEK